MEFHLTTPLAASLRCSTRLVFSACLQKWLATLNQTLTDRGVQLYGKTLRRSFDTASGKAALHLVNAWSIDLQACCSGPQFSGAALR